jgi:hypothetical protein
MGLLQLTNILTILNTIGYLELIGSIFTWICYYSLILVVSPSFILIPFGLIYLMWKKKYLETFLLGMLYSFVIWVIWILDLDLDTIISISIIEIIIGGLFLWKKYCK